MHHPQLPYEMLPERNELKVLLQQLAEMEEMDHDFESELDSVYLDSKFRAVLKNDGEDKKRLALIDFDVDAHKELAEDLLEEGQYETYKVIEWFLSEYARLFPARNVS